MPVRAPFAVLLPENKSSRPCLQPGCRSDQRRTLRSLSWVSSLSFLQRFFDLMAGPGSAKGGEASEGIGSADACPLLEVCRPLAWPSACACWGGPPPGPSLVNLRRGAAFAQTLEPLQVATTTHIHRVIPFQFTRPSRMLIASRARDHHLPIQSVL